MGFNALVYQNDGSPQAVPEDCFQFLDRAENYTLMGLYIYGLPCPADVRGWLLSLTTPTDSLKVYVGRVMIQFSFPQPTLPKGGVFV